MTQLHFFGVLSFGTICNAVQCTVFPEKGTLLFFRVLDFLKDKEPLNTRRELRRFLGTRHTVIFNRFLFFF